MKQLGFDDIAQLLSSVGRDSLFSYYGVRPDAPGPVLEQAISERRRWAQGMQSNPKYRGEAVWLIRNNSRLKDLLINNRAAYLGQLSDEKDEANLEFLSLFIRGTMFSGTFSPEAEEAIRRQAEQLGITDDVLEERIELLLSENGASRLAELRRAKKEPVAPPPTISMALPQALKAEPAYADHVRGKPVEGSGSIELIREPATPSPGHTRPIHDEPVRFERPTRLAPVPAPVEAPRAADPSAAAQLTGLIHDAMSKGRLPSHVLNQLLADGQRENLDEAALFAKVQHAIASHTTQTQGPPPRRPKQRPQPPVGRGRQRPQLPQAPRPSTGASTGPGASRTEAVRGLVDTLRGAMLQGVFGEPTLRAMRSRALSLGLEVATVHDLIEQARNQLGNYRSGVEDPYTTLGMARNLSLKELQQGYRELRGWAWSHPDPLQCAGTSIRFDAAWCAIREAKSLHR
ncbi:MAG: hypothetical protein GY913_15725 [Proteobacteria bacterium]|nr:hypothetical protein [Pseudomonadota bacterium]MCP4918354.1 hypothetical protein [Pseudomonadota bacterium]